MPFSSFSPIVLNINWRKPKGIKTILVKFNLNTSWTNSSLGILKKKKKVRIESHELFEQFFFFLLKK